MPIAREESGAVWCSSSSADHRAAVAADSVAEQKSKRTNGQMRRWQTKIKALRRYFEMMIEST